MKLKAFPSLSRIVGITAAPFCVLWLLFTPVSAAAPDADVLKKLTKGEWTLRYRDSGKTQKICVRSGRELIQLQHREPGCTQQVVRSTASSVTIQYTCRGNGHGHTELRRETASLAQITSRGIAGGLPFDVSAEARRTGTCS